jgi:hypothetical protein
MRNGTSWFILQNAQFKTSMRFGFIPSLGAKNEEETRHGDTATPLFFINIESNFFL